jgi:hypothetical protein
MVRDNRHDPAYISGAICPASGAAAAIVLSAADSEAMSGHLKEVATRVARSAVAVAVCYGAGMAPARQAPEGSGQHSPPVAGAPNTLRHLN